MGAIAKYFCGLATFFLAVFNVPHVPKYLEAAMVSSNILRRVFTIRVGSGQATGFTIEVDDRQYLITARHVVSYSTSPTTIEIFHDKKWVKVQVRSVFVEPSTVDIAVVALSEQLSDLLPIQPIGTKGSYLSQDVFFVGFPYGLSIDGHALNSGFPLPLVKHGIIAAIANGRGEPFLVDGINNPGFSGGPVVQSENPKNPAIIGVVSGYRAVHESVYKEKTKTDLTVQANTGLLVAYDLEYAIEAIKKNPVGYRVKSVP
jgi:S1-C subfamily serine protease